MGLVSGSATFRHYKIPRIDLTSSAVDINKIWEHMNYRKFVPIPPESVDTRRGGWCSLGKPYRTDFELQHVYHEWGFMIGMRIDTYRIPSALVKDRLAKKKVEWLKENYPDTDPKMVRIEKETLREWKDEVTALIRIEGDVVPSTSYSDVLLDFRKGDAFLFSHSKAHDEVFFTLFQHTFPDFEIMDGGYLELATQAIEKWGEETGLDLIERFGDLSVPEALQ